MISVDPTHVIFPRNTEYEVFSVNGKRHTLGAVFILNHRTVFQKGMPPVAAIAEQAHREGALLDLDKHSWPWSMMLVPVMKVDLYELTNNHIWRAPFFFRQFGTAPPDYTPSTKHSWKRTRTSTSATPSPIIRSGSFSTCSPMTTS